MAGEKLSPEERSALGSQIKTIGQYLPLSKQAAGYAGQAYSSWGPEIERFMQFPSGSPDLPSGISPRYLGDWFQGSGARRWELQGLNVGAERARNLAGALEPSASRAGTLRRQAGTAFGNLLTEFSIGGAYFRAMAVNRLLGRPVQQWSQMAGQMGMAQAGFGMAMGAPAETFMGTPMGQIAQMQADLGGFQMGMGESALMSQAGLISMMGGEGPSYQFGRGLGGVVTPAMRGAQAGLLTGIGLAAVGGAGAVAGGAATGATGLAAGMVGVGSVAGPIGLLAGLTVAGTLYAGEAWQMGAPENIQRELLEQEMGHRQNLSFGTLMGQHMRNIQGPGPGGEPKFEGSPGQTLLRTLRGGGTVQEAMQAAWGTEPTVEGMKEEFLGRLDAATINIMKAQIHLSEGVDLPGVTPEGALRLGGMLEYVGAGAGDIGAGQYDQMLRQMAPLEMTGLTGQAMTSLLGVSRSLGIAPGQGMMPYMQSILEGGMGRASLARMEMAAGIVGPTAAFAGVTPSPAALGGYAGQLEQGVPQWQLQLQAQREYGTLPIAQAMGVTPGSALATAIGQAATTMGPGVLTGGQVTEVPSGQFYKAPLEYTPGQIQLTPGQAQMQGQIAAQYGQIADVRGYTPQGAAAYYARLEQEARGEPVLTPAGTTYISGVTPQERFRREQAAAGIGAEAMGLPAGTQRAMDYMAERPEDYVGANIFNMATALGGPEAQAMGMGPSDMARTRQQYEAAIRQGVSPAALGIASQIRGQGGGAISAAFGIPAGLGGAFEEPFAQMLSSGTMSQREYQQASSLFQFGQGQMGYSMMAGNWGIGEQLGGLFGAMGMAPPEGAMPLYTQEQVPGAPEGTMGVYALGALEQRQERWDYTMASQQNTLRPIVHQLETVIPELREFRTQMRAINKEMADAQYGQSVRGVEQQKQRLQLQTEQALETLGLRERMFHVQTAFRRQEMEIGYEQFQQRTDWQREEMAASRQVAGFQFEFQQGELRRGIRLAGGRERARLMRQREYQEEMFSFAEGRRGRQEGQFETQAKWQEERYEREKAHFEEMTSLQQNMFDMQRRHIIERYSMEMGFLGEQLAHLAKMKELQDTRRKLQEEFEDKQLDWREDQLEQTKAFYEGHVFPYQKSQLQWQNTIADAHATYTNQQILGINKLGDVWTDMINQIIAKIEEHYPAIGVNYLSGFDPIAADFRRLRLPTEGPPRPETESPYRGSGPEAGASVKLVVGQQEFDAYLEGAVIQTNERQASTKNWGVYGRE
jgi:hypothetical protein